MTEVDTPPGTGVLDVSVGGNNVPIVAIGAGPNYTLYSANISTWAGETEQLTFSAPETAFLNGWAVDDISFSPAPEPNIVALTAIAGLVFGARRWLARV
jgi:hypothetical protein